MVIMVTKGEAPAAGGDAPESATAKMQPDTEGIPSAVQNSTSAPGENTTTAAAEQATLSRLP